MLSLNKYQKTKEGETVMPVAISGDTVQCVNTKGNVVIRNIRDFSDSKEEKESHERIIEVSPIEEQNTDFFFDKKETEMLEYDSEFFKEEEKTEPKETKNEKAGKPQKETKEHKKTNFYVNNDDYI